jgi:quercetin dioxygenase-like cupin family protein
MSRTPFVTEAEAIKEPHEGRTNFWLCHPDITAAEDLQAIRAVIPAGGGHDFHTHPELEEIIYVLDGKIEQWVGESKQVLHAGELAHIPRGRVHATFNPFGDDALILAVLSPGSQKGPMLVDVSDEEPWKSLKESR